MPERQWATCIECGWTGIVEMDVMGCPSCGYIVNMNISITEKEKDIVVKKYIDRKLIIGKQFINKYNKWNK